jgi:hypothetical protein
MADHMIIVISFQIFTDENRAESMVKVWKKEGGRDACVEIAMFSLTAVSF